MSEIGKEIRRLRKEKGWTQTQLAVYAASSQATINQIESGARNPSTRTLEKVAVALELEVRDLFPKKSQAPLPFEDEQRGETQPVGLDSVLYRRAYLQWSNALLSRVSRGLADYKQRYEELFTNYTTRPFQDYVGDWYSWLEQTRGEIEEFQDVAAGNLLTKANEVREVSQELRKLWREAQSFSGEMFRKARAAGEQLQIIEELESKFAEEEIQPLKRGHA